MKKIEETKAADNAKKLASSQQATDNSQPNESYCFFMANDFGLHVQQTMIVKKSECSDRAAEKSILVVLY